MPQHRALCQGSAQEASFATENKASLARQLTSMRQAGFWLTDPDQLGMTWAPERRKGSGIKPFRAILRSLVVVRWAEGKSARWYWSWERPLQTGNANDRKSTAYAHKEQAATAPVPPKKAVRKLGSLLTAASHTLDRNDTRPRWMSLTTAGPAHRSDSRNVWVEAQGLRRWGASNSTARGLRLGISTGCTGSMWELSLHCSKTVDFVMECKLRAFWNRCELKVRAMNPSSSCTAGEDLWNAASH